MKKILIICFIVLLFPLEIIYADEDEYIDPDEPSVGCQVYRYHSDTTNYSEPYNIITTTVTNDTGTTQSHTINRTRTITFTGSISPGITVSQVQTELSISVEIGFGYTSTISVSATTSIPPHTTYYVDIGSMRQTRIGNIIDMHEDCSTTNYPYSIKFTTGEYVHWYE